MIPMKRVLCYGDSNTWGYTPGTGARYAQGIRWTGVMAEQLGPEYCIIEDGITGRTTVWDDPFDPCRNGLEGLGYGIHRAKPIDLVVLMLGTNDLNYTDAYGYYKGLNNLIRRILHADSIFAGPESVFPNGPKLLLVSPIRIHPDVASRRPEIHLAHAYADSCCFADYTRRLSQEWNLPWLDAAAVAEPSEIDCLHMDADSHKKLGIQIAEKIRMIL